MLCKHGVVGSFWGLNESRRERKTGEVKRMSLLGWWETTGQARNEKEKERRRKEKRKARMERSRVKRESALQENKPQARRTDQRESSKREKGGEWSQKKVGLLHAVILRYGSGTPRPVRTAGQWRERKVAIRTGTSLSFTFRTGRFHWDFRPEMKPMVLPLVSHIANRCCRPPLIGIGCVAPLFAEKDIYIFVAREMPNGEVN